MGNKAGSILSIGSTGSILSIGSAGSILSIGSTGSILSIGSAGSVLSVGSFASAGSVLSALSVWSVLAWRSRSAWSGDRRPLAVPRTPTLPAVPTTGPAAASSRQVATIAARASGSSMTGLQV